MSDQGKTSKPAAAPEATAAKPLVPAATTAMNPIVAPPVADAAAEKAEVAAKAEAEKADAKAEAEKAAAATVDEGKMTITVIGPVAGRYRAGFRFGAAPMVVEVDVAQMKAIAADSLLSWVEGASPGVSEVAAGEPAEKPDAASFITKDGTPAEIIVIGPIAGRWRAGVQFGQQPTRFTPSLEQLDAILADGTLSVQRA